MPGTFSRKRPASSALSSATTKRRKPAPRRRKNMRTGGFMGIEYKFVDQVYAATVLGTTVASAEVDPAANSCLNAIAEGDGQSARDGRKYTITGVHVQGVLLRQNRNDQTEVGDANWAKIALVLDTQTNGAQCNSEDVFTSAGSAALSFKNLQYSKRFKILHQEVICVPPGQVAYNGVADQLEAGGSAVYFSINKKLRIPVICTGTGATVASIGDNSLHMIACAHTGGAANDNSIELAYTARVRFVG